MVLAPTMLTPPAGVIVDIVPHDIVVVCPCPGLADSVALIGPSDVVGGVVAAYRVEAPNDVNAVERIGGVPAISHNRISSDRAVVAAVQEQALLIVVHEGIAANRDLVGV